MERRRRRRGRRRERRRGKTRGEYDGRWMRRRGEVMEWEREERGDREPYKLFFKWRESDECMCDKTV